MCSLLMVISHKVTDTITKVLKSILDKLQTLLDHIENATHSLWFTKLTTSRPSYSATHPDPTHVMLLCTLINFNLMRLVCRNFRL